MTGDDLSIPDFLLVRNRTPLTPEQEAKVAELYARAPAPRADLLSRRTPEEVEEIRRIAEEERQQKIAAMKNRLSRKRESRGTPPTGAVWDVRTSRWVMPGDRTTVSQVIQEGHVPPAEPTVREIMNSLRAKRQTRKDPMPKTQITAKPNFAAMSGKGLIDAYNEITGGNRKARFSSAAEGIAACERAWEQKSGGSKTGSLPPATDERSEKAAKLRAELSGKKPPLKADATVAAGKKLVAQSRQPSEGKRAGKLAMTIKVITEKNPRREGTDAHRHYEVMRGGITVLQYLEKFAPEDRRTAAQWLSNTVRDGHVEVK